MNKIMTTTSVVPRYRLRPKFKDLRVGEHAWASNFAIKVLADGSAYLNKDADIRHFAGSQPWPNHNKYGDFLIERIEGGYCLHIFGEDVFCPTENEFVEGDNHVQIIKIVDHGSDWVKCEACGGAGILKKEEQCK